MAEPEVKTEQENTLSDKGEISEENVEKNLSLDRSSDILAGLNLVLILSSLSVSDEEHPNLEEIEEREGGKFKHKAKSKSDLNGRRQEVNGFKAVERQQSKLPTKIRDFR
ncbi:hypothetical protein CDL12_28032 [Handroanthus impetiginosus]|uniref:Uncharacterized protein n=1 Tax=Handroanthus impetiginosus TaxID=429701 RepID=A0A2G9G2V3_9LAMI|nr:hypothetical protein CDL12_28032 [Handroanthus impetiginosus]